MNRAELLRYIFWYDLVARVATSRNSVRFEEKDALARFLAQLWRFQSGVQQFDPGNPMLAVEEKKARFRFHRDDLPALIRQPDRDQATLQFFYPGQPFWNHANDVLHRAVLLTEEAREAKQSVDTLSGRWASDLMRVRAVLEELVVVSWLRLPEGNAADAEHAGRLAKLLLRPEPAIPYLGVVFNGVHGGTVFVGIESNENEIATIKSEERVERAERLGADVKKKGSEAEINVDPRRIRRPYRVLVIGSKILTTKRNREIAKRIGYALIAQTPYTVMTGGLRAYHDDANTVDRIAIEDGAASAIREHNQDVKRRVLTMLPENDEEGRSRFNMGEVQTAERADTTGRRAKMIMEADAIVAIDGGDGTYNMVWQAQGKPLLPIPSTGTSPTSAVTKYWSQPGAAIQPRFAASESEIRFLTDPNIDPGQVADTVVALLLRCLPRRAYISAPLDAKGLSRLRQGVRHADYDLLEEEATGDRLAARRDALRASDVVIADTAHLDTTVSFELGMASALAKHIVLVTTGTRPFSLPSHLTNYAIIRFSREDVISDELAGLLRALSPQRNEE